MKKRGLKGVRLFTTDKCVGLVNALGAAFPAAMCQRCIVHFYRNVFTAVPSYREIVRRLSGEGVKTQRGGTWQVSTLRHIVSNRFYTGRVEFDGGFVRGRHEAIVPHELFERAQRGNGTGKHSGEEASAQRER